MKKNICLISLLMMFFWCGLVQAEDTELKVIASGDILTLNNQTSKENQDYQSVIEKTLKTQTPTQVAKAEPIKLRSAVAQTQVATPTTTTSNNLTPGQVQTSQVNQEIIVVSESPEIARKKALEKKRKQAFEDELKSERE